MARAGVLYPQATVTAGALADRGVVRVAATATVREAWQRAQRAGARTVVTGSDTAAGLETLERACRWGLGGRSLPAVAWHALPRVGGTAGEVAVRRAVAAGAPLVLVQERGAVVGAIEASQVELPAATWSVLPALEHPGDPDAERRLWLLRTAGKLGEALGMTVYAVGGVVRDVLLARPALDVDLVVEGDGVAFATRLGEDLGGRLVTHKAFGTAALEGARTPDGQPLPRIDVATARVEAYARPGALPTVRPGPLGADLARRDFSVNAMALTLAPAAFGRLVDPHGGRRDLAARRLRPLHPLAFVEDPTRVVRAARYGARLGFTLDAMGTRALALATSVPAYPGLSAARLRGELALTASEPTGWRALADLARWGGFRFAHPGVRARAATVRRLRAAAALTDREAWRRLGLDRLHVAVAVLLLDQPPAVGRGVARGLGIVEEAAEALAGAPVAARAVLRALRGRPAPSAIARALRAAPGPAASAAWVEASAVGRRRIEWYWSAGQAVRPHLSGAQVMGAGVPPGPAVGACLAALRDARLDGQAVTEADERELLMRWRQKGVMR